MESTNDISQGVSDRSLSEWHRYISDHFSKLARLRQTSKHSVFALEHNLTKVEVAQISQKLRQQLKLTAGIRSNWLPLVVYATEVGYEYLGEEYWQTFESQTPGWEFHHREDLRWAFVQFQKHFNGVVPSGKWANHFSIIAWPITHAILPKDLQLNLAKALYYSRHKLGKSQNDNQLLGKILAANSYSINSTRFQNFLEQEELVGRIASSIVGESSTNNGIETIAKVTLARIVDDLEAKSNAKNWVDLARMEYKARVLGTRGVGKYSKENSTKLGEAKPLSTRPIFQLQWHDPKSWVVEIEIPDLTSTLDDAETAVAFRGTRFKVNGVSGNWLPTSVLTTGSFRRQVTEWPNNGSLLSLEGSQDCLRRFEESVCLVDCEFPLVFKLNSFGTAREIRGKVVRPGNKYIIVYTHPTSQTEQLSPVRIKCGGILGAELNIPENPQVEFLELLKGLGVTYSKSIVIYPVGLQARLWDGEGFCQWLTTEAPCFSIYQDHDVSGYEIWIGNETLKVTSRTSGSYTFFRISELLSGSYNLKVQAKGQGEEIVAEGLITLEVREPNPWIPNQGHQSSFIAFIEPADSSLDNFLAGRTNLRVYGPPGYSVQLHYQLTSENQVLTTLKPKTLNLPINTTEVRESLRSIVSNEHFESTDGINLIASFGQLGRQVLHLSRSIDPLRWTIKSNGNSKLLSLIDDMDSRDKAIVSLFSINSPTSEQLQTTVDWTKPRDVKNTVALLRARKGKFEKSIIVSHTSSTHGFDSLVVNPDIPPLSGDRILSFCKWLSYARSWHSARCSSLIAYAHRKRVLEEFITKILSELCGEGWPGQELRFLENKDFNRAIHDFADGVVNRSMANIICHRLKTMSNLDVYPKKEKKWFVDAVVRCKIYHEDYIPHFALQIAANPLIIDESFRRDFTNNLHAVLGNKTLMRSARCFVIGLSRLVHPGKEDAQIMPAGLRW